MSDRREHSTRAQPQSTAVGVGAWIGAGGEAIAAALAGRFADEIERDWGWNVVAIGGQRRATAAAWGSRTGAVEVGTLREIARAGVSVVLLLGRDEPGEEDLRLLLEGSRTVILGPLTPWRLATALDLRDRASRVCAVPALQLSDSMRVAQPLIDELRGDGPIVSASIRLRCCGGEASVEAMLNEACAAACELLAEPESVIAMSRSPRSPAEPRSIVAIVRAVDGGVATIEAADRGGWGREIELVGAGGRLRMSDGLIERWHADGAPGERHALDGPVDVIGAAVESLRAIARRRTSMGPPDTGGLGRIIAALSVAEAIRLGARTGNPESPARVRELVAGP